MADTSAPAQAEGSGIQAMLDDLDDLDDVEEEALGAADAAGDDEGERAEKRGRTGSDAAGDAVGDAAETDGFAMPAKRARPAGPDAAGGVPTCSVFERAQLLRRPAFQRHMRLVDEALTLPAPAAVTGIVEDHPEYRLTVDSNHLLAELRDEAEAVRAFIAALYQQRFAELSEVVADPLQYSRVVRELRDCPADRIPALAPRLEAFLPASTVMVITVSGSALDACRLTEEQLGRLDEACDAAEAIASSRDRLLRFVESRMAFLAPNISALVGPRLASELVGLAGGVAALARIPACNIQVMGRSKQSANGLSRLSVKAHNGLVHEAPLVKSAPPQLRQRAAKVLAGKVALVARVDAHGTPGSDATVGNRFYTEITDKIAQWAEPPEVKAVKPLPKPEPKKSRKRGGKRFRRIKEKYGLTEVRKAANRLAVDQSATEYSESAMGNDGGMLAAGGAGRLRVAAKEQKNLLRTAAMRKAKARAGGSAADPLSGLASTIAFSHTSGMELVDPEAVRRRRAKATASAGYFDDAGGFSVVAIVAIYLARPAGVDVFSRVMAWQSMGSMVAVEVEGLPSGEAVFVVDDKPDATSAQDLPPLLFIHGFPTSSFDWKDVWPALCHKAGRRCIALDLLGYGLSSKPDTNYSVAMHASVVRQVLASTVGPTTRVEVIAHDLGCTVVQELLASEAGCSADSKDSAAMPCSLSAVVLLNGGVLPGHHHPQPVQTLLAHPVAGPLLQRLMIRPVFGLALARVFGEHTKPSLIELDEDFALCAHNDGLGRTHAHLSYMADRQRNGDRYANALANAASPILFLNGPADPVSGRHLAEAISSTITRVDVRVLPDHVGHFPQREMPGPTATIAARWLEQERQRASTS